LIATQGPAARNTVLRTLETARRKLRETIEKHPDALPSSTQDLWRCGFFPGMLWILAGSLQSEHHADAPWWLDQAIRYSKPLADLDGDGLGFALLPSCCRWAELTRDPIAEQTIVQAARRLVSRLRQQDGAPTVSSLMDAILLLHASALSGDAELRAAASTHCLAARRLLVRGDGSLAVNSDSTRDLAWAIHGFGAAYRFTRDPRFLGASESCAACLLETLPADGLPEDSTAGAIAASALMQLSSQAADSAKARFYALAAREFFTTLEQRHLAHADAEGLLADAGESATCADYFFLDAIGRCAGLAAQPSMSLLLADAPAARFETPVEPIAEPAPSAPEPEPEKEPEEPGRRPVRALTFLLAPLVFFLLVDLVFFRSNFYTRYIEPDSSEGTFEAAFQHEITRARAPKEVIVLGSSRIAEGFSAKRANLLEPANGYWFVNGAVSGAGARPMYYMVRDMDPNRNRYKAIVMTIDDYTDPDDLEDLADRVEDLYSVAARLGFSDIFPFMQSYTTRKSKWAVFSGALLKTIVYQRDLQEFLDHPSDRLAKVELYKGRYGWAYDYGGSDHSLAGATVDWTTKTIVFPPSVSKPDQDYMRPRLIVTAPQNGRVRAYQIRWLGAIADRYRNSKTRLIFIQAPRSPLPRPVSLAHWKSTTVDELAKRPWVTVVDRHTFEYLERPELFSDYAHLNSEGQKIFSPALAATVKSILEPKPQAAQPSVGQTIVSRGLPGGEAAARRP